LPEENDFEEEKKNEEDENFEDIVENIVKGVLERVDQ